MEDLIAEVNRALRARGWSAQHASRQLGGSPEFIRNLRRGYFTSLEKFRNLCEILELEFYVGPKREPGAVDERRLEHSIAILERVLAESDFVLDPEDKASAVTVDLRLQPGRALARDHLEGEADPCRHVRRTQRFGREDAKVTSARLQVVTPTLQNARFAPMRKTSE